MASGVVVEKLRGYRGSCTLCVYPKKHDEIKNLLGETFEVEAEGRDITNEDIGEGAKSTWGGDYSMADIKWHE